MYMTQIIIDSGNRQGLKNLADANKIHQWLAASFSDSKRMLWRMESVENPMVIVTVSDEQPDNEKLSVNAKQTKTIDYDKFLSKIQNGGVYSFSLRANPVIAHSRGVGHNSKVVPCKTIESQQTWLTARRDTGYEILSSGIARSEELSFMHHHHKIRLRQVTYKGILRVINADDVRRVLTHGLGREKAFGMGLMTLVPISFGK